MSLNRTGTETAAVKVDFHKIVARNGAKFEMFKIVFGHSKLSKEELCLNLLQLGTLWGYVLNGATLDLVKFEEQVKIMQKNILIMELYDYKFILANKKSATKKIQGRVLKFEKEIQLTEKRESNPVLNYSSQNNTLKDYRKYKFIKKNIETNRNIIKRTNQQIANSEKAESKRPIYGHHMFNTGIVEFHSDFQKAIHLAKKNVQWNDFENASECLQIIILIQRNYESDLNAQLIDNEKINKIKALETRYLLIKSQILIGMKKYVNAIDCLQKILNLDANHFEALRSLAICYIKLRLFKESGECIKRLGSVGVDSLYLQEVKKIFRKKIGK